MQDPRPTDAVAAAQALPQAHQLHLARRRFFDEGSDPGVLVPESIARSWRRCSTIPSRGVGKPEPLPNDELFSRRDAQGRLRHHALPELEALAEALVPSRVIVLLADPEGMILDAAGSDTFMTKAQRVALMPGVDWSEGSRGTNAIGTALTDASPVTVLGLQHYLEQNSALGFTATPLLAPDGHVMGVLDVSGDPRCIQAQNSSLVRMAGQMIEHRLALDTWPPDTEILRFAHDPALIGTHREALLWVRNGIVVGANRASLRVLGMRFEQLYERYVEDLFTTLPVSGPVPTRLQLQPHLMQPGRFSVWSACWVRSAQRAPARVHAVDAPPAIDAPVIPAPRAFAPQWVSPQATIEPGDDAPPVIDDPARHSQLSRAVRVMGAGIPVLVTGESGVGKEVFARQLHAAGTRASGPFVAVNCAAVPESLIESELFGYEPGAFTGARRRGQAGLIREADGGVLFLDEIGDMPLLLQARLLRVLQDREVRPLGGAQAQSVDFALVCATHRRLAELVDEGRFRADLYYRLQHFTVELPALREQPDRRERIAELLHHMLERHGLRLSEQAREAMLGCQWPGNWRELVGVCRTLRALGEPGQRLELADLPASVRDCLRRQRAASRPDAPMGVEPGPAVADESAVQADLRSLTAAAMQAALDACEGNVSRAARMLGVHRSTLYRHAAQRGA